MGNVTILVGTQWGDEGKGKWIDILAKDSNTIARYQGGNNAGHTLYVNDEKVVLHQIPSGIFHNKICALTAGVVVNPEELVLEIEKIRDKVEISPENIWISPRSHIITPWNIYQDKKSELEAKNPIGTTKRGIGPTYADKAARTGLRTGDFIKPKRLDEWLQTSINRCPEFKKFYGDQKENWDNFCQSAEKIAPFVCDAEDLIRKKIKDSHNILIEGAQGTLLDVTHGTYPFVTSSHTVSGGAISSLGIPPSSVTRIIGIAKSYTTRVGDGPFPTELFCESGKQLAKKGNEFGATTGRPRRCGWLDLVALKYSVEVNALTELILNKFDTLNGFETVKLATSYIHPQLGKIESFPWDCDTLTSCEPVYEEFKGWDSLSHDSIVPEEVKKYLDRIEQFVGCKVSFIGTGVGRGDYIKTP